MSKKIEELENIVLSNCADPAFVELAACYRMESKFEQALMVCLRGLNITPGNNKGRLELARAYYELGLFTFAQKEVNELNKSVPNNSSIKRLMELLKPLS